MDGCWSNYYITIKNNSCYQASVKILLNHLHNINLALILRRAFGIIIKTGYDINR